MQQRLEILVEERSMENFLSQLLPRILPEQYKLGESCFIRAHEGKSHLKKTIPRKASAYKNFPDDVRMLIIQDQDSSDCKELKQDLIQDVRENNAEIPLLVRIACRELENWYLGDLLAVEKLYPESRAKQKMNKSKFRNPDTLQGSSEMKKLDKTFAKGQCASEIVQYMQLEDNKSQSFQCFLTGLKKFLR